MPACPPAGPVIPLSEVQEQEEPGPKSKEVLVMVQVRRPQGHP